MLDRSRIQRICAAFATPGFFAVGEGIPWEKEEEARSAFPLPEGEAVLGLADFSADGTNREGLAVCEGGIWWHSRGARGSRPWSAFAGARPALHGEVLQVDAGIAVYPHAAGGARLLLDLLERLSEAARAPVAVRAEPVEPRPAVFRVDRLAALLRNFRASVPKDHRQDFRVEGFIPERKLANAVAAFPIPPDERVLALLDSTSFGSNKTGMAIGTRGIYCRNMFGANSGFLSWEVLRACSVSTGFQLVKVGSLEVELAGSTLRRADGVRLLELLRGWAEEEMAELARPRAPEPTQAPGSGDPAFDEGGLRRMEEMRSWVEAHGFPPMPAFPEMAREFPTMPGPAGFPRSPAYPGAFPPGEAPPAPRTPAPPPAPRPERRWMLAVDGQQFGPFEEVTIATMLQAGEVDVEHCFAWTDGMPDWLPFRGVPELAALLAGSPPPRMSPPPPPPGRRPGGVQPGRTVDY